MENEKPEEAAEGGTKDLSKLFTALSKAQAEFTDVSKNKTANIPMKKGGSYSYKFATLPDIRKAVQPALTKNGLSIIQRINTDSLQTMLCHESGQWIDSKMSLNTRLLPQEIGSLLTYYRRYQLSSILNVAADEDEDGTAANNAAKGQQNRGNRQQNNRGNSGPPPITEKMINRWVAIFRGHETEDNPMGWNATEVAEVVERLSKKKVEYIIKAQYDRFEDKFKKVSYAEAIEKINNPGARPKPKTEERTERVPSDLDKGEKRHDGNGEAGGDFEDFNPYHPDGPGKN